MALLTDDTVFGEDGGDPERSMVLVASADGPTRIAVTRTIARLGLTTVITLDGEAALLAIDDHDRNLLGAVLDAQLLLLSGWDVARALHSMAIEIPLVVLDRGDPVSPYHLADVPTVPASDLSSLTDSL